MFSQELWFLLLNTTREGYTQHPTLVLPNPCSKVKLQAVSSPVVSGKGQFPMQVDSFGLSNLKLSHFPPPTSAQPQLMLMSVLTCLFESLNHVLR